MLTAKGWGSLIALGLLGTLVVTHGLGDMKTRKDLTKANDTARAWKSNAEDWRKSAQGWEASFRKSDGIRAAETGVARAAVDQAAASCNARVAAARRSTEKIRTLLEKEPARDPVTNCPVSSLLPNGELRDAIAAAAPTR